MQQAGRILAFACWTDQDPAVVRRRGGGVQQRGEPGGATGRHLRWALAVALLTVLVWSPSLSGEFVWDDVSNLVDTDRLRAPGAVLEAFRHDAMWSAGAEQAAVATYRPLALASFALDFQLHGPGPLGFHISSVLLHALAAALLFLFFARWTRGPAVAFGLAVIWAVHPTAAEAVAWINGRSEVLAFLCGISAALVVSRPGLGVGRLLAAGLLLLLALCGKETGIIFVPVTVWLAGEADGRAAPGRPLLERVHWPMAVSAVAALGAYFLLRDQALTGGAAAGMGHAPQAVMALPAVWARALQAAIMPLDRAVVHLHLWLLEMPSPERVAYGAAAALTLAIVGAAWWKGERVAAVALLWWLGSLTPVALVVVKSWPGLYRWLYVGLPGLLLGAWLLALHRIPGRALRLIFFSVAGLLTLQTQRAIAVWHDDGALWMQMIEEQPDAAFGYIGLGSYVLYRGQRDLARELLEKAIALTPRRPEPYFLMASLKIDEGDCEGAWKAVASRVSTDIIPAHLIGQVARCFEGRGDRAPAISLYRLCAPRFAPCGDRLRGMNPREGEAGGP